MYEIVPPNQNNTFDSLKTLLTIFGWFINFNSIGKNGFSGGLTQVRYFNMAISPYDILKIYSWGPHPFEVVDPDKLKNELESISGSIQISASVSS